MCVLVHACMLSHLTYVWLFATPWTVAPQAPLSMGFPSESTEAGVLPSSRGSSWPRDLTHVNLCLLHSQTGSLPLASPGKPHVYVHMCVCVHVYADTHKQISQ